MKKTNILELVTNLKEGKTTRAEEFMDVTFNSVLYFEDQILLLDKGTTFSKVTELLKNLTGSDTFELMQLDHSTFAATI